MLLRMLSFLLYQQHTWSLQHVLYFFLPTIFFSPGRVVFRTICYFMLYIACIFLFVMREVCPAVSTITIPPLCAIPSRLLYSPNPLGYLYPTRAYPLDTLE